MFLSASTVANQAESPIEGGLGITFGEPVAQALLGAELEQVPSIATQAAADAVTNDPAATASSTDPIAVPPGAAPWRIYRSPTLPLPFRNMSHRSFVMLDEQGHAMRVISQISHQGCGQEFEWLTKTLSKKYRLRGTPQHTPKPPFAKGLRVVFTDRQINVLCGPHLIIDFADHGAIERWLSIAKQHMADTKRLQRDMERRRMLLDQRRARRFADTFTLGDQYRLMGAFGVAFQQPFAPRSTQKFPVDTPFTAVLPNMPEAFTDGDLILELGPDRVPITIRGRFKNLAFSRIEAALRAKYGSPLKSSKRHIVHKVSGNHAILKQLTAEQIEVAFIDSLARSAQQQRLWERESEGL